MLAASAQGSHLVSARGDAAGPGLGQGLRPGEPGGDDLGTARFRTRLIYRMIAYHGRKTKKKGFLERDLAGMIDAAHQQLGRANIVLVWDNDTAHRDAAMKKLIAERPWLTVFYLPAYTPTLNPVEGLWSVLKRSLANLAPHTTDAPAAPVKTRLRCIQYRREGLLDGFIAETGLALEPP